MKLQRATCILYYTQYIKWLNLSRWVDTGERLPRLNDLMAAYNTGEREVVADHRSCGDTLFRGAVINIDE